MNAADERSRKDAVNRGAIGSLHPREIAMN